jgi:hypothetical protein
MLADIVRAGSLVIPVCGGHERIRIGEGESASTVRHEDADAETDSVHQSDDQDARSGAMESMYHGRNCTSVHLIRPGFWAARTPSFYATGAYSAVLVQIQLAMKGLAGLLYEIGVSQACGLQSGRTPMSSNTYASVLDLA